ncbi:MAG: hypothetical protein RL757_525 [Bacteroidota bacterium]
MAINHPNTLLDVTATVILPYRKYSFLANYSLFKNPILNFILTSLYCIPIKRRQDVAEGEVRDNSQAFSIVDKHLSSGGNLFIAPEGSSFQERHVREFRTGIARVAFAAEAKADWKLQLNIIPLGVTYETPGDMGGSVVVHVGEPIRVADWQAQYVADPVKASDDFALWLEKRFHDLTLHCADRNEDLFLQKIEAIFDVKKRLIGIDPSAWYDRSRVLLEKLHALKKSPNEFQIVENQINTYFEILEKNNLKAPKTARIGGWGILLSLPIYLYGALNNLLVAAFSEATREKLEQDESYDSTIKYATGALVFLPLFYWLQTKGIAAVLKILGYDPTWAWIYLLTLIPTGIFAHFVYREGAVFFNRKRYESLEPRVREQLEQLNNHIINAFQKS